MKTEKKRSLSLSESAGETVSPHLFKGSGHRCSSSDPSGGDCQGQHWLREDNSGAPVPAGQPRCQR